MQRKGEGEECTIIKEKSNQNDFDYFFVIIIKEKLGALEILVFVF